MNLEESISPIAPNKDELPSQFADRLGMEYSARVSGEYKKSNGQFFTPVGIADYMGNLAESAPNIRELHILDPGCGTGILSCSLIEKLVLNNENLRKIRLTVYETDNDLIPYTQNALDYLQVWLQSRNVSLSCTLSANDFILDNEGCFEDSDSLFFSGNSYGKYDIAILNPPYFKIPKEDKRAIVATSIVYGQPNIYSIFLSTAAKLLKSGGGIIFITPRSFSSGHYFRAFRESFLSEIELDNIHLFGSRTDTFNRDEVLQEVLIIRGTKKSNAPNRSSELTLTSSRGIEDLTSPVISRYRTSDLIDFNTKEKIIHLPVTEEEGRIIRLFKSWSGNLRKYNIQISTGPVVAFRAKDLLHEKPGRNIVLAPLFQLHNASMMSLRWPLRKGSKAQYIEIREETMPLLIPNKNYIFLRRFSSKDDKSRLVATPYSADTVQSGYIGVESRIDYIDRPGGILSQNESFGFATIFNSGLFDTYLRTLNGDTDLSAAGLREIPLPDLDSIKRIGDMIIAERGVSQEKIDEIVSQVCYYEEVAVCG